MIDIKDSNAVTASNAPSKGAETVKEAGSIPFEKLKESNYHTPVQCTLLDSLFAKNLSEKDAESKRQETSEASEKADEKHPTGTPYNKQEAVAARQEKNENSRFTSRDKEDVDKQYSSAKEIISIPISQIVPNSNQPRKLFPESSILKLADSIGQHGMIQPITVRKLGHIYELVAGERRLRAAKELGWSHVPCITSNVSTEKSAELSIIENLVRENLNIFEQAIAIQALLDTYALTQEEIAKRLSSSQSYVANKLRLLRLTASEREKILSYGLTERHARALLRISDIELREKALDTVISKEFNVSSTENLVKSLLENSDNAREEQPKPVTAPTYKDISSFCNAITRAIDMAKTSELGIKCRKLDGEEFTELTIIIPKSKQKDMHNT